MAPRAGRGSGVFVDVADHPATVLATTAAHRELRDVSPAALAAVADTSRLTGDVVRLHRDVTTRLTEDWYDEVDLLREAVAAIARSRSPGPSWSTSPKT